MKCCGVSVCVYDWDSDLWPSNCRGLVTCLVGVKKFTGQHQQPSTGHCGPRPKHGNVETFSGKQNAAVRLCSSLPAPLSTFLCGKNVFAYFSTVLSPVVCDCLHQIFVLDGWINERMGGFLLTGSVLHVFGPGAWMCLFGFLPVHGTFLPHLIWLT